MSRICPLFSGSKANCTYISCESGEFIIDIGCSYRSFLQAFKNVGGDLSLIRGIFITHEHTDHILGLKMFLKNNSVPLFASRGTISALIAENVIPEGCDVVIADENEIEINGLIISRFATSHDCRDSSGYSFTVPNGEKVSVCTDTGILTEDSKKHLIGSKAVLIESNHDITMLKNGPYTPKLKMRILSSVGHLSNTACSQFLPELLKSGTNRIILGHLSQNNNTPLLAISSAHNSLSVIGATMGKDYILTAAAPKDNEVIVF